jgi:hypothetical protein
MRVACFALLILTACTSAPDTTPDPAARPNDVRVAGTGGGIRGSAMRVNPSYDVTFDTINATVDKVWAALPAVYTALSIPLTTADPKSLRFGNEGMRIRRRLGDTQLVKLLDCGRSQIGENAESYEIMMSVMSTLQQLSPQTTRVTTSIEASGKPIQFAGAETRCRSKGELERQISLALRARFAS